MDKRTLGVVALGTLAVVLIWGPIVPTFTGYALTMLSFIVFLWAVVGLINPTWDRVPNRLASVGIWAISVGMLFVGAILLSDVVPPQTGQREPPASARTATRGRVADQPPQSADSAIPAVGRRPARPTRPAADFTVSPAVLLREFRENEIRAGRKYAGKSVAVSGSIDQIRESLFGGGYVVFTSSKLLSSVQAQFNDEDVLINLPPSHHITVQCDNVEGGPVLRVSLSRCRTM